MNALLATFPSQTMERSIEINFHEDTEERGLLDTKSGDANPRACFSQRNLAKEFYYPKGIAFLQEKIEQNIRELRNVKSINVAREKRLMKGQLQNVQVRIDNLLLMQGQASSQEALKLVMQTFESLSKEKAELENRLARMSSGADQDEAVKESVQIIKENLREFERAYRKAKGSMKKRLMRKLLKQVVLSPEGLHIFMQLADGIEIPNHQIKLIRFEGPKDEKNPQYALTRKASGDDSNLQVLSEKNQKKSPKNRKTW